MNKNILLLRTLLRSTSQRNKYKYCKDKKKRRMIRANFVGYALVYLVIMAYCIATCIGYGKIGIIDSAPVVCALMLCTIAFFFTLFKTNGYLFNFKEYDMLMSLPFETKTVAACKFMYMVIKSLPWYISISVAMMIGYGIYAKPAFYVYPLWLILSMIVPVVPTLLATFFGFIIAKLTAGFRKRNILQTVVIFAFMILCFAARPLLEDMFKNNKVEQVLTSMSDATEQAAGVILPAKWFSDAVTKTDVVSILLLVGISVVLFALVFLIIGSTYRKINSAMKNHAAAKKFRMTEQKQRSVLSTIAYKEFKRFTGSSVYMVNVGIGEVLAALIGLVTLILGFDRLIGLVTGNAPFDHAVVIPAIPFIVYFCLGMMATTAASPSLEGKNYWIVQSLPIEMKTLYQGKMLFNMYLTVPFMALSTLCMSISARVSVLDIFLYLILGFVLCTFSTTWGCACGVKHMKLEWENEIEVVKQGAAVAVYLFPNMLLCLACGALTVYLGMKMDHRLVMLIMIAGFAGLAALSYRRVLSLVRAKGKKN